MPLPRTVNSFRFVFEGGILQASWKATSPTRAVPEFDVLEAPIGVKVSISTDTVNRTATFAASTFENSRYAIAVLLLGGKRMSVPPVTVHLIRKVGRLNFGRAGNKVVASWVVPPSHSTVDGYELVLFDETEPRTFAVKRTVDQGLEIVDNLVVGHRYVVEVRAHRDNSFGEWTRSAVYEHLADGRLRRLLERLKAAELDDKLELSPALLGQESRVVDLLPHVLGIEDKTLRLTHPQFFERSNGLSIGASTPLFGAVVPAKLRFSLEREDGPMRFEIEADLGSRTLAQYRSLARLVAPAQAFWETSFALNLLRFDSAALEVPLSVEGDARSVTLNSPAGRWRVELVGARPRLDIVAVSAAAGQTFAPRLSLVAEMRLADSSAGAVDVLVGQVRINLGVGDPGSILEAGVRLLAGSPASPPVYPGRLVDGLIGAGRYALVAAPGALPKPEQIAASADLRLDLTQGSLLMWGILDDKIPGLRYARTALRIKRQGDKAGFFLAGVLQSGSAAQPRLLRLSELSPGLEGLDASIGIQLDQAALAITDIEDQTAADLTLAGSSIPAGLSVLPGLNFFVKLDFSATSTDPLFRNMRELVTLPNTATLSGHIPADSGPITLTARLESRTPAGANQLKFLNLDFNEAQFDYRIGALQGEPAAREKTLALKGQLSLTVDTRVFVFRGRIQIDRSQVRSRVALLNDTPFPNPLGLPALTLERLAAGIVVDFDAAGRATRKEIGIVGQLRIGDSAALVGTLGFVDNVARLVLIELLEIKTDDTGKPIDAPASLALSQLFNKVFEAADGAQALTWPDALDIRLHDGELAWAPPDKPAIGFRNKIYEPGFHAKALATIFGVDVAVGVSLKTVAPKGLSAQASFVNPIDWGFVRFTGTTTAGRQSQGPTLSIDTQRAAAVQPALGLERSAAVQLALGLELLGAHCGDLVLAAGREVLRGSLVLPSGAGPFANNNVNFVWNEPRKKFSVNDLQVKKFALPIPVKIKLKKDGGACAKVISDLFPLDGDFDVAVGMTIEPPSGGASVARLVAAVDVTYSMKFLRIPLFSLSLPTIQFGANIPNPSAFTWGGMAQAISSGISENAQAISDAIMEDPLAWVAIILSSAATEILQKMTEYAVCRNNLDKVGAQAMLDGLAKALTAGAAAVGGGAALGALAGFAGNLLPAAVPAKPAKPALVLDNQRLLVSWRVTERAELQAIQESLDKTAAFRVDITSGGHTVALPQPFVHRKHGGSGSAFTLDDLTKTLTVDAALLTPGELCTATVTAIGIAALSAPSETAVIWLASPSARLENQSIVVEWPAVARLQYSVELAQANGTPIGVPSDTERVSLGASQRAVIPLWSFPAGNPLRVLVSVQASAAGAVARSAALPIDLPISLGTPQNLVATRVGDRLEARWNDVPGASSYQVRVLDMAERPIAGQGITTVQNASLSMTVSFADQPLKLAVRAVSAAAFGVPQTVVCTRQLASLGTAQDLRVFVDALNDTLTVSWTAIPGAQNQRVRVTASSTFTNVLPTFGDQIANGSSLTLPLNRPRFLDKLVFSAQVQVLGPDQTVGPLSLVANGFAPSPPEGLTVLLASGGEADHGLPPGTVTLGWDAPADNTHGPTTDEVHLDGTRIIEKLQTPGPGLRSSADVSTLLPGRVHRLQLARRNAAGRSELTTDFEHLMLPPAAPSVSLDQRRLVIEWPSVAGLVYEVHVDDISGSPVVPELDMTRSLTGGKERAVVSLWSFPAGQPLRVAVTVHASTADGLVRTRSASTSTDLPITLPAPAFRSAHRRPRDKVTIAHWEKVPGATAYEARLLNPDGSPGALTPEPVPLGEFPEFAAPTEPDQRIAVRALGPGNSFGTATLVGPLVFPVPPEDIGVEIDDNTLELRWSAVTGERYAVVVTPTPGIVETGSQSQTAIPLADAPPYFDMSRLGVPHELSARVVVTKDSLSISSAPKTLLLSPPQVSWHWRKADELRIDVMPIQNLTSIKVQLTGANGEAVAFDIAETTRADQGRSLTLRGIPPAPALLALRLKPVRAPQAGTLGGVGRELKALIERTAAFSDAAMPAPANVSVSVTRDGLLQVSWEALATHPDLQSYDWGLEDAVTGERVPFSAPAVRVPLAAMPRISASAAVNLQALDPNKFYRAVVCGAKGSTGAQAGFAALGPRGTAALGTALVLEAAGADKSRVAQLIQTLTGFDPTRCGQLVDRAPRVIRRVWFSDDAQAVKQQFVDAGATVNLR